MTFGETLKVLRQRNNLKQEQLAKKMGVKQYVISGWEIGRSEPSMREIFKLADIFKVSIDKLLGRVKLDRYEGDEQLDYMIDLFHSLNKSQKKEFVLIMQSICRLMKKEV